MVAQYLVTGGDLERAVALANAETPEKKPVTETGTADLPALFPPVVFIAQPAEPESTTHESHLRLVAEARSVNEEPLREVWVTVNGRRPEAGGLQRFQDGRRLLRPSKFEGHCPMIRHGCRMALMVALNWSVECVKEES